MNNLLEVANIYLHYRGGKHVGLAGLVGVIVAIIITLMWTDWIQPIVNFFGLNKVADNMGIVVDGIGGGPATAYNVLILYLFACLAFSLIIGISLLIFVYGSTAIQTNFGAVVFSIIIFIIFSPILIWFTFSQVSKYNKERNRAMDNPKAYEEEQRLKKNEELFNYLIHTTEKNGKTNKVRKLDAVRYLNDMPSEEGGRFLVGITYDRDPVLLLPRPFGTTIYGTEHRLLGVTLSFDNYIPAKHNPHGVNTDDPHHYFMKYGKELKQWDIDEIELFIHPKDVYDVQLVLKGIHKSFFYRNYVDMVSKHYEMNKDKGMNQNNIVLEQ